MNDDKNFLTDDQQKKAQEEAELIRSLIEHDSDPNKDKDMGEEAVKRIDEHKQGNS